MSKDNLASAMLACLLIAGCAKNKYQIPDYRPQETSISSTPSRLPSPVKKYSVNSATPNPIAQTATGCRAGALILPDDGKSFTEYLSDALASELMKAGIYDGKSGDALSIQAVHVDVNTTKFNWDPRVGEAIWHIEAEYSLQGRLSSVTTDYSFRLSHANGHIACSEAAFAFPGAAREIVQAIIKNLAQ